MDSRFLPHNQHWHSPEKFSSLDPNLLQLAEMPLVHQPDILQQLPMDIPGIYSITGGRQVGKTTMLKQWMQQLLAHGVTPKSIAYITGELIDDHHALLNMVFSLREEMDTDGIHFLIVDEVTYIRDWDKAVKFMADSGQTNNMVLLLTGSDSVLIQQARTRFPGRRGVADQVDFHLYPLSFREVVNLKHGVEIVGQQLEKDACTFLKNELFAYMEHGGYLTAINDMAKHQRILPATLRIYADWIRGDMLKHGKQDHYLREILSGIIKRYSSQISWNALSRDLSIDHPKTVSDYIDLLTCMDALFVQHALQMDKLIAAPKKARKVIFTDPFILHAARSWLKADAQPYESIIKPLIADAQWRGKLVESIVVNHFSRLQPTYYIKTSKGEVDIAIVHERNIFPIEIKWTSQLRSQDLKLVRNMPRSRVWANVSEQFDLDGMTIEPLPLALYNIENYLQMNFLR
jgi:predicted AAA+ superfamily ATPase